MTRIFAFFGRPIKPYVPNTVPLGRANSTPAEGTLSIWLDGPMRIHMLLQQDCQGQPCLVRGGPIIDRDVSIYRNAGWNFTPQSWHLPGPMAVEAPGSCALVPYSHRHMGRGKPGGAAPQAPRPAQFSVFTVFAS